MKLTFDSSAAAWVLSALIFTGAIPRCKACDIIITADNFAGATKDGLYCKQELCLIELGMNVKEAGE